MTGLVFFAVICVIAHPLLRGLPWVCGPISHTLLEVVSTALAAFVTMLAFVRYYSRKDNTLLLISAGLAGATVLEAFHTLVTAFRLHENLASPLPAVVPWSWLSARLLLGGMFFLSHLAWVSDCRAGGVFRVSKPLNEGLVYSAVGSLAVASCAFVFFVPLPPLIYPNLFLARPLELLPAFFFLYAFLGFWRQGMWRHDAFHYCLLLALLAGFLGHVLFMAFSKDMTDAMLGGAHILKAMGFGLMLIGLLLNIRGLYREAELSAAQVVQVNERLNEQVLQREAAMQALQLEEKRLRALACLSEMTDAPLKEVTDFALEQAVALTGSKIGYLAFLNEDETVLTMHSWSKSAMEECAIADKTMIYPVVDTGLWGEAVRQRKPVITNDYEAGGSLKKGCPQGHVAVTRHMNIPVFDGDRIVGVAGVGNKEKGYDDSDVLQLQLLMSCMWRLVHRKRVLEELRELTRTLEKRVDERTALAESRLRDLERSNAELERFAYVASHDLQEPLRMVAGYTQLLARRYQGKLDQDADDFIHFAVDGALRMKAMINDLLSFSRVGRVQKPLELTPCKAAFEHALADLEVSIEESGAVVTSDDLPQVMGDAIQLERLFQNLLSNAIKFRGEQPPRIHVGVAPEDGHWHFSVRDNGIGISSEYSGRMFQIFQRFHERSKYPGTGIGLALCKRIVERHGGSIWAESSPGEGSTFHFTIPAKEGTNHG